jgi:hypothetical protein
VTEAILDVTAAPRRMWFDRVLAALPLVTVFVWLCFFYAWQSWGHVTPWLFSDEVKLADISRSIAHTGHPGIRGKSGFFYTLYAYILAPAWWIKDVHTAYAVAKYIGAITMTTAVFPAYWLARLVVSRRLALLAALGSGVIPALYYAPELVQEPLAYPFSTLTLFLISKALLTYRKGWVWAAVAAAVVAPLVRSQLAVLPAILLMAWLLQLWSTERARAWRSAWSWRDWAGFVTLLLGLFFILSAFLSYHSTSWHIATYFWGRMFKYGLYAAGSFTIGLGIVPVILGLSSLAPVRRGEPRPEPERLFIIVFAAALAGFGLYTAIKASYISAVFSTITYERNLMYLAPLLFTGTALFLQRRRTNLLAFAAAAGFALFLILTTPYQMQLHFVSDAPGVAILEAANRKLSWTPGDARIALLALFALAVAVPLAVQLTRPGRTLAVAVLGALMVVVLGWNLTGEISAASASNSFAHDFLANVPDPPDWIQQNTHGAPTMYLGERINDPNPIWLTEFWNPAVQYVWSIDGTAPGPGPTETPDLQSADGALEQQRVRVKYVVLDSDVFDVAGPQIAQIGRWRLVKYHWPLRLRRTISGFYNDGWMAGHAFYARFSSSGTKPGQVTVTVSRAGWGGTDVPGHVTIRVGRLNVRPGQTLDGLKLAGVTATRRWTLHSLGQREFTIATPKPPFGVSVDISPTFVPSELDPRISDKRKLGAVVGFTFVEQ